MKSQKNQENIWPLNCSKKKFKLADAGQWRSGDWSASASWTTLVAFIQQLMFFK